jgi:murein L,D-transpeptidase YafK
MRWLRLSWRRLQRGIRKRRNRRVVLGAAGAVLAAGLAVACASVYLSCTRNLEHDVPVISPPSYHVLVEKAAHRLTLFDANQLVRTYHVAIGGGRGDKLREGDKCTPEGDFFVCYKNPKSKYVLSLGLSYPGEKDADRGLRERSITPEQHDAIVSAVRGRSFDANTWEALWKTPLGGEIMIHGTRGERDSTLGCVAMDDDAIRELYRLLPYGTAVRIVP